MYIKIFLYIHIEYKMDFLKCRLCNIKELPKPKDRTDNTLYMYKGSVRIWKNNYLLCIHNKRLRRCEECNLVDYKKNEEHYKKKKLLDKKLIEKRREQQLKTEIRYRKKHKDKIKERNKEYRKDNIDKIMQLHKQWKNKNKSDVFIKSWKRQGLKHTDNHLKEIFKRREESTKCELCNTKYTKPHDKCCDHHHSSGSFRNICCKKCNNNRGTIDRKMDKVLLELHKYFINNSLYN